MADPVDKREEDNAIENSNASSSLLNRAVGYLKAHKPVAATSAVVIIGLVVLVGVVVTSNDSESPAEDVSETSSQDLQAEDFSIETKEDLENAIRELESIEAADDSSLDPLDQYDTDN